MADFSYDPEQDILDVRLDRVSHNSVPVGGLVIDLTNDGELAGIEILNASENISNLSDVSKDEMKEILDNIDEVRVSSDSDRGMLVVKVDFVGYVGEERVETSMPFNVEAPA